MDIITHTLSGMAIGTVVASFVKSPVHKAGILCIATFGGALPDLDVISLWSGFDNTIGTFFNLGQSGKVIYFSKYWYSHHGFMHSLLACTLIAVMMGLAGFIIKKALFRNTPQNIIQHFRQIRYYLLAFTLAYTLHLLEDMPTPASVWGGVNFFWPAQTYTGGLGKIWWWNNYDLFLIVVSVIIINSLVLVLHKLIKVKPHQVTPFVFALGILLALYQINTRPVNFNYNGHTTQYQAYEKQSKAFQQKLLGDRLFHVMEQFDKKMSLNF